MMEFGAKQLNQISGEKIIEILISSSRKYNIYMTVNEIATMLHKVLTRFLMAINRNGISKLNFFLF